MATGVALKILGEQEQMDEDYFSSKRSLSCLPICKANLDTIVGGFVKRANVIVKVPSNKRVLIRAMLMTVEEYGTEKVTKLRERLAGFFEKHSLCDPVCSTCSQVFLARSIYNITGCHLRNPRMCPRCPLPRCEEGRHLHSMRMNGDKEGLPMLQLLCLSCEHKCVVGRVACELRVDWGIDEDALASYGEASFD